MEAPVVKAIIFDCFGVLYTDSKSAVRSIVSKEKQQLLTDIYTRNDYGYISKSEFLGEVALLAGLKPADIQRLMYKEHALNTALKSFISDQLRGRYDIGLLSNVGRGWINDFFDEHELHALFDEVVLSSEEHVAKPDPAIFQLIADRLGHKPSECLMVDDLEDNCDGAEAAGLQAILYQNNDQLIDALHKTLSDL